MDVVVISGLGRSGTSFIARLVKTLGYPIQGPWVGPMDAGLEDMAILEREVRLMKGEKADLCSAINQQIRICPIIKSPRLFHFAGDIPIVQLWHECLQRNGHILKLIICRRDIDDIAKSWQRVKNVATMIGDHTVEGLQRRWTIAMDYIKKNQVAHQFIDFPECVYDPTKIVKTFKAFGICHDEKRIIKHWLFIADKGKIHIGKDVI